MALEIGIGGESEEYTDWRGQRADPRKHGGVKAASLACVVEVLENMVFLSNATNFVTYFMKSMHYPNAEAANMVTNFTGTSFLLTIFGGFIADSFFTRFRTFLVFGTMELLGLVLLTVQAQCTNLQPTGNRRPSQSQAAILCTGLYAMATGIGGIKASLPAHGADQLDRDNQSHISTFFNWFFFSLCTGGLLASTIMIWIEENLGWTWSFKISLVSLGLALGIFSVGFPIYRFKRRGGSPITRIFKVIASAIRNGKVAAVTSNELEGGSPCKLRFLDKALIDGTTSKDDVKETKTFIGLLPIFASTIMMNCCLAQLQTFSVEQGDFMDRTLGKFRIPTQSMTIFPLTVMLVSIPLYEHFAHLSKTKNSPNSYIFQPLKRIGLGLALASASMAVAALVEAKRRAAAENKVTLSVFWMGWQYLLLGVSDMLILGGMLEFFYSEAPSSMRSICTALAWCSTSIGYFLSSILVSICNSLSGKFGREWLGGHDLNQNRLDLFYAVLCVLNFVNLLIYIYWAKRHKPMTA